MLPMGGGKGKQMSEKTKYCKFCGEMIDFDCVVCPKCGKQVEVLKGNDTPIVINNSSSSSSSATVQSKFRKLPWYLRGFWIIVLGMLTGGIYWIVGIIMRVNWKSHN